MVVYVLIGGLITIDEIQLLLAQGLYLVTQARDLR